MKLNIQLFSTGGDGEDLGKNTMYGEIMYIGEFDKSTYEEIPQFNNTSGKAYLVITQVLGDLYKKDDSTMYACIKDDPGIEYIDYSWMTWNMPIYEKKFTNYGKSTHYYNDIIFNDVKYIFTPAGIITPIEIGSYYSVAGRRTENAFEIFNINDGDFISTFGKKKYTGAYIPTLSIGLTPTGLNGTTFETVNMLTSKRKNSFLGTAGTTTYQLIEKGLDSTTVIAEKLNSDGTYTTITEGAGLTVNRTTGVITFSTAPGVSPVTGRDNVIITYAKTKMKDYIQELMQTFMNVSYTYTISKTINSTLVKATISSGIGENNYTEGSGFTVNRSTGVITIGTEMYNILLNNPGYYIIFFYSHTDTIQDESYLICYQHAKNITSFGYEQDRRVFVNDSTNRDFYSNANDITYFPDINYTVIGDESPIIGYARDSGYLFTFKQGTDSIYVRQGMLINDTVTFPSLNDSPNINVLGKPIEIDNNEILVPTTNGIERIYYYNNEVKNELRSYYINNELKFTNDFWKDYTWYASNEKLYILLTNGKCLVADLLQKTYVKEGSSPTGSRYSTSLSYQYEWYLWDNMPNGIIKEYFYINDKVVYIYNKTSVYKLDESNLYDTQRYSITEYSGTNAGNLYGTYIKILPVNGYWETPFLDFNQINISKTIKNLYLNTRSTTGDYFEIGYILPDGTTEILEQHYGTITDTFPKLIQIKNKIKKFMNVKLYIKNKTYPTDSNLINIISFQSTVSNGITYNVDTNKNVTMNGTSTNNSYYYCITSKMFITSTKQFKIKFANPLPNGVSCRISNGVTLIDTVNSGQSEKTFSISSLDNFLSIKFITNLGTTVNSVNITPKLYDITTVTTPIEYNYGEALPYISNPQLYKNTTFNRLLIEYQAAGKYRGE